MSGWVYGPGGATNPGGDNKQIQFNDGGSFGGDADLTFDKAASTLTVTGSVRITGRYHGDGSGLTGVTASAVNVADGPEFALQFRSNSPVSGELSGTANLMYSKGAVDTLHMTGNVRVGGDLNIISAGTASMSHLSGNSPINLHASFALAEGIPLVIGNPTIGNDCTNVVTINSRVTASCDFLFESQVTASTGLSSSLFILNPFSGSIAGPGSYLGLDANNRVVITGSDTGVPSPGGSNTQVQFNDAGAFQGDSGLVYNKTTDTLTAVRVTASNGIDPQGPGTNSIQVGDASARTTNAIAIGNSAVAESLDSIAIGPAASSSMHHSIAIGDGAKNFTNPGAAGYAISIGVNAESNEPGDIAIGSANGIPTHADGGIAIGQQARARSAGTAIAIGNSATGSRSGALAIGYNAFATASSGYYPTAIGYSAQATAANTIALGSGSINATANSMTIGSPSQGMDFNVTGNVTLLNNGDNSYGHLNVCQGTASILHLSGCSPITVHSPMQMQQGLSLSFNGASNTAKITNNGSNLDINSPGSIVLNSGNSTITSSANISASAFYVNGVELTPGVTTNPGGSDTQVQFNQNGSFAGNGGLKYNGSGSLTLSGSDSGFQVSDFVLGDSSNKIGFLAVEEDEGYIFTIGSDVGGIDLSGSDGITAIVAKGTNFTVASQFTNTGFVLSNMDGDAAVDIGHDGAISGSNNLAAGGTFTVAGNSTFNNTVNLNAAVTSSNIIVSTTPAGTGAGLQLSASNTSFGPGQVYGQLYFGSGSIGGSGWSGTEISLSDFGGGEEFEFRAKNGATTVRADNGDATLRATAGEVILSGSAGIVGQTTVNLNAGLSTNNNSVSINAGMSVNNTALTINSSLQNNGISTFNDTATFNNSASVHNQGLTVNNAAATINNNLVANGNITLGNASGDGVTWNAGSWDMSANAVVSTLKDGVDGISGNGALMFFTGSGGDLMKFHTSGSAKGIVFPQQTYLSKGGALSGSKAGPGSYLALDASNKIVLTTAGGAATSPGGSDGQVQFNQNGSFAGDSGLIYNGSGSISIGTSQPKTALDVHYTGSGNPVGLENDTGGGEIVYFGTSSAALSTGALYYLNSAGGWQSVNSANTGSGHNQLLGISMGTDPRANGMLIKGYFDVSTYISGAFIKGSPVYIQSSSFGRHATAGGYISGAAPTAVDSYVRVVGYGTDTANVIYFNPDSTYVEIG